MNILTAFIAKVLSAGFRFHRLIDVYQSLKAGDVIPTHEVVFGHVRGRALEVALQGEEVRGEGQNNDEGTAKKVPS